jgi:hypothetical protein
VNKNESMTSVNVQGAVKAVLREKFVGIKDYMPMCQGKTVD